MSQLTLFGSQASHQSFFSKPPSTLYQEFIEALWFVKRDHRTRSEWFQWAQSEWKSKTTKERTSVVEEFTRKKARRPAAQGETTRDATALLRPRKRGYFTIGTAEQEEVQRMPKSRKVCVVSSPNDEMIPSSSGVVTRDNVEEECDTPSLLQECDHRALVNNMIQHLGVCSNSLLTPDVTARTDFMTVLEALAEAWTKHQELTAVYSSHKKWSWKKSQISKGEDSLRMKEQEIKVAMAELINVQVNTSDILSLSGMRCALEKVEKLTKLIALIVEFTEALKEQDHLLQHRITQLSSSKSNLSSQYIIDCAQPKMSWAESEENLIDLLSSNGESGGPLSHKQLLDALNHLSVSNSMLLGNVLRAVEFGHCVNAYVRKAIVVQLLSWMPLLSIFKKTDSQWLLVNIHDFYSGTDMFQHFLKASEPEPEEMEILDDAVMHKNQVRLDPLPHGRIPVCKKFPAIVQKTLEFVQLHGFSAQERRRTGCGKSNGVTLGELQSYLTAIVPGLTSISRTTIHELMVPPRKGTVNAHRYRSLVQARVPAKQNTVHGNHQDSHFCLAQVAYMKEFSQNFLSEVALISCDNKNKVNVGTLAVSRYHQIQRFFPSDDSPNYRDHDFPFANSKIVPSGYLLLESKRQSRSTVRGSSRLRSASSPTQRNQSQTNIECIEHTRSKSVPPPDASCEMVNRADSNRMKRDRFGRLHFNVPHTGRLFVKNRAARFHDATSQTHANDLSEIISDVQLPSGKTGLCLIVDGGPDYSIKSMLTIFNFGRLWKDQNLDFLIMTTHAPGDSAYNSIEHAWAPLSKLLTGVTLPISLANQEEILNTAPNADNRSPEAVEIFDNAISLLNVYWNGKSYDGFPISSTGIGCTDIPNPYSDHDELVTFLATGITKVRSERTLQVKRAELQFLLHHAVRTSYTLTFLKCESVACQHCSNYPVRAVKSAAFLRRHGGHLMVPRPSLQLPGHFCTYMEYDSYQQDVSPLPLDTGLPSLQQQTSENYICSICKRYVFRSKADKERHLSLVHDCRGKKHHASQPSTSQSLHKCTYQGCGVVFATHYQLTRHKTESGHKCTRGRKKSV